VIRVDREIRKPQTTDNGKKIGMKNKRRELSRVVAAGWVSLIALGLAPRGVAQSGEDYLTGLVFDALTYNSGVLFWKADCPANETVTRI